MIMTIKEIEEKVATFLIEDFEIEPDVIRRDALLKEDLGIDSLDFVDIVVIVEREFGFKPQAAELKQTKTFADFCAYIEQHVNG